MIVSCPSCSARYKIDDAKIKGRGARITCPRCTHRFVVFKAGESGSTPAGASPARRAVPDPTATVVGGAPEPAAKPRRDFETVGVTWRVRTASGRIETFHTLDTLEDWLDRRRINRTDSITYDGRTWVPIAGIPNLETYFEDVWGKAQRNEIPPPPPSTIASAEEDAEDAPTTLMGHGSSLADEIRRAVEAAPPTPADAPDRASVPPPLPRMGPPPVGPEPTVADPFAKFADEQSAPADDDAEEAGIGIWPIVVVAVLLILLVPVALAAFGVINVPGVGGGDAIDSPLVSEPEPEPEPEVVPDAGNDTPDATPAEPDEPAESSDPPEPAEPAAEPSSAEPE